MTKRVTLRKPIAFRITSDAECVACFGSGFRLKHERSETFNFIKAEITVCPCVKLAVAKVNENAPKRTA